MDNIGYLKAMKTISREVLILFLMLLIALSLLKMAGSEHLCLEF